MKLNSLKLLTAGMLAVTMFAFPSLADDNVKEKAAVKPIVVTEATNKADENGRWIQNQDGWWWKNPDGSYPADTWAWIDGNHDGYAECYYFYENGYIAVGTEKDGYKVNENGAWVIGSSIQRKPSAFNEKTTNSKVKVIKSAFVPSTDEWSSEVIILINKEREKEGLPALEETGTLDSIAKTRSEELSQEFSHNRPNGQDCFSLFDENGLGKGYCGESIAAGCVSPEDAVKAWMEKDDRENILSKNFKYIGVSVQHIGTRYYFVQEFAG